MKKHSHINGSGFTSEETDPVNYEQDPFKIFRSLFMKALSIYPDHANAMTPSTADHKGRSSSRIVLLKSLENDGFVFFTNYLSRKGKELEHNPYASLLFFWPGLKLQIRIEGKTVKTEPEFSSEYFAMRPSESQEGAWTSMQSGIIPDRSFLEKKVQEIRKKFHGRKIPRPPYWGGYKLIPEYFEFWLDRPGRLHDRIFFHWKTIPGKREGFFLNQFKLLHKLPLTDLL